MRLNKNFSLVLSGGGALGIAHLGVLEDLEDRGLIPSEIVGTSMGGIVGACVAIGLKEKEIFALIEEFSNLFNWIKFSFKGNSIIKSEKIEDIFETIFGDLKIKEAKIPLKLIATKLSDGDKKVFSKDDEIYIKDALLATMAIPGIFEEKVIDGVAYGDGFLCENLGILEADLDDVLAVDVLGKNSFYRSLPNNFLKTKNVLDMFEKSMRLLIYNQTKTNLKNCKKDILLIEPDTKEYKTFHFHKFKEIKELGKGLL
ncbi:MAG: patatin-like phospholipase family protein [Epsilonproteobacteria bacterium]|nr:patatin-like phospholipase family protein [Campylobacterota bacterium]